MNTGDNYLERSSQIDRYVNDEMVETERIQFEKLLQKDEKLAEAVDFAKKEKLAIRYQEDINIARFLNAFDDKIPLDKPAKNLDEMNALAAQIRREMMAQELMQYKN